MTPTHRARCRWDPSRRAAAGILALVAMVASPRVLPAQQPSPPLSAGAHLPSPLVLLGSESAPPYLPPLADFRSAADSSYNWSAGWIGAVAGAAGAVAIVALFAGGASDSEDGPALSYIGVGVLGGLIGFFTGLVIGNQ